MQLARYLRTSGLLVAVGLAGVGVGCGLGSPAPISQEEDNQIRESKKKAHRELKEDAKKAQGDWSKPGDSRKGAHRGAAGR